MAVIAVSAPYRLARLTSFLNPWARPFDTGYQLTQSLIAFGRGGWFGAGLGRSIQKMFYLPEAHTDFLFAVIAEELGLMGMMTIIGLFLLLVVRVFMIGREAQFLGRHFAGFLAYGFGLWIAIQFTVSIGVNSGLLPTKGLTLPLMSYGGSSVLVNCMVVAVLLRIDHENRLTALGIRTTVEDSI
jgi:cell division protein FtsW